MKKFIQVFFVGFIGIFLSFSISQGQNLHILVNIWDGTEITILEDLLNQGKLPYLSSIGSLHNLTSNTDCFSGTCMKPVTKCQHATMLTGCLADVHGVYSNSKYQLIPDGITVYELIEANNPNYRTAHIAGKGNNVGEPTFGNIVTEVDFFQAGNLSPRFVTDTTINLITQWKDYSFFIVCHFPKPDEAGHKFGVDSIEYRKKVLQNDALLGELFSALNANSSNAETTIYVLSDHGFGCPNPFHHGCAPHTFITSNDVNLTGDIFMKDVAGFFLSHFGLSPACQ